MINAVNVQGSDTTKVETRLGAGKKENIGLF
jgi:hypothetical protein